MPAALPMRLGDETVAGSSPAWYGQLMWSIMNLGCPKPGLGPALSILMGVAAACSAPPTPATRTGAEPTEQHRQLRDPGALPEEPGTVPSEAEPDRACAKDDECILSTFPGCCSCCLCSSLHALRADVEQRLQDGCARIKCEAKDCSAAPCVPCGSVAATVRAACVEGLCSVVP